MVDFQIYRFISEDKTGEKKLTKGEDFELKSWADLKTLETTPNCGTMKMEKWQKKFEWVCQPSNSSSCKGLKICGFEVCL